MSSSSPFLGLRGLRLKIAMVVLVVTPAFLLFGYNNGSTGGIVGLDSFAHVRRSYSVQILPRTNHLQTFPSIDTVNTKGALKTHNSRILGELHCASVSDSATKLTPLGVVTAVYDLGAVCGALSSIAYSDKIGRLRTILSGLVLSVVALAIESSAYSLAQFVVGRILVGGAIGILSASIPVWQTECSTTKHRGMFVILEGIFISAGISMSEWMSLGFYYAFSDTAQWRVTLVFPVIFVFLVMPCLFLMPESPRWLLMKGRIDEARVIVAAMMDKDIDSHEVNAEIYHIQHSLENSNSQAKSLFTNGKERYFHRAVLAGTAQAMTQLCGVSALIFYTSIIVSDLGYIGIQGRLISCGFVSTFTMAAFVPLFTVDKIGRRKLFMLSLVGLSISMAVMAGTSGRARLAVVSVVFMFIFAFSYAIGLLGLPFLYASEIAGLRMRVPISAIAVSCQWIGQFIIGQVTPFGTANLHNRYWIIFAVFNACFIPIIYFFFPETNGRSLEEIDDIFGRSGVFTVVSNAKRLPRDIDEDIMDLEHRFEHHASQESGKDETGIDKLFCNEIENTGRDCTEGE